MTTMNVKNGDGLTETVEKPLPPGRAAASASKPMVLSNEDFAAVGALTETAPGTDTASSGLNGRLQRIAQRITSLIALLPTALGQGTMAQSLRVVLPSDQSAIPATVANNQVTVTTINIANGQSISGDTDLGTARMARIAMPASWTTAVLTFQASYDNTNWSDLYDASGNEYTVQAAASRSILLPVSDFYGIRYVKIRSGTSGSPVAQGGSRDLQVTLVN